ncbi:MAG: GbsR/MarR family transcriptional regulator [Verrucomicrobiales bacterium]
MSGSTDQLTEARDAFVEQWGSMGSAWGINRTMAQIHALLMVSESPLCTDEIMDELKISRGNANSNLRELTGWGLVRGFVPKGERKEYFEAEKDVWRIFCTVVRERKRREIEPVLQVLERCLEKTEGLQSRPAQEFRAQISSLQTFVSMANVAMDRVAASEKNELLPLAAKFLARRGKPGKNG